MDVKIIAGPGRSGKTTCLQQEIIDTTIREPQQRIIYIVPEQSTLMVQKQLLDRHPRHGILHVEILSFNRLAYRILQEAGKDQYTTLDDMGKSMLLYKTALDHREELLYYGRSIRRPGFIGQLKIMLTEIYQYRLDDGLFDRVMSELPQESTLYRKLHDIRILFEAFQERTAGDSIPSERLLDLLAEAIPGSDLLEGADIYMDDFYGFTPQQYMVLGALLKKARHVRLTLAADERTLQAKAQGSLYFQALMILDRFEEMGIRYSVRMLHDSHAAPELQLLAEGLFRPAAQRDPVKASAVQAHKARRPEEEVEWVLSRILQDVRNGNMTFSETAIVAGSAGSYLPLLERLGRRWHIPVFIDQRIRLQDHPAVRMLEAALQMVSHRFTYDTVFAWAKTGFLPFAAEELDSLENEALRYGWRGMLRYEEGLRELCVEEAEKEAVIARVFAALKALAVSRASADTYTQALESLMDALAMEEQLLQRAEWLKEHDQPLLSGFYEQTYDAIRKVLEQMHLVLGIEEVTLQEYAEILEIGFSQSKVGLLPPVSDQVQVADVGRSRLQSVRNLYVIGFQDTAFPGTVEEPGLLTDAERKKLSIFHDVAADRALRMGEQEFYLYSTLGKASEKVFFTWSAGDGQGHSLRPSQYVQQMEKLFDPETLYDAEPVKPMHPDWLLDSLARGDLKGADGAAARRWISRNGGGEALRLLDEARTDPVPEEKLERGELWDILDLDHRSVSVTQLEQYASCPLAYYFRYGLQLREREVLSVRALDDGNVLHALLEEIGPQLARMIELPPEEIETRMDRLLDEHSADFSRYRASSRYQYYWKKLKATASRAVTILQEQIRRGEFVPEAFEWTFGRGEGMAPALEISLEDGRSLSLMGKIDRIDILREEEQSYVRILDYKSGRTEWDPWELYEGLKLQLPIYLEAYRQASEAKPAGIFYFHLTPKIQKADDKGEPREEQILKSASLDGLVLNDPAIAQKMDRNLVPGNASAVIPARRKKDGQLSVTMKTADAGQFEQLLAFAHEKAAEIGAAILDGHAQPHPVLSKTALACSHCPYAGACRLDPSRHPDQVRRADAHADQDFWSLIE